MNSRLFNDTVSEFAGKLDYTPVSRFSEINVSRTSRFTKPKGLRWRYEFARLRNSTILCEKKKKK